MIRIKSRSLGFGNRLRILAGVSVEMPEGSFDSSSRRETLTFQKRQQRNVRQTQRRRREIGGRRIDVGGNVGMQEISSLLGMKSKSADEVWRQMNLDSQTLDRMSLDELLVILVDVSPQMSKILWDLLRFGNPGYEVTGLGLDEKPNDAIQKWADNLMATLDRTHGIAGILFNRLFVSLALRGAVFGEIVLDESGKVLDITADDPLLADFERHEVAGRGKVWQVGQTINGRFVNLSNSLGVVYIPLDPLPNTPYGRSMLAPSSFSVIFILGLLHDLKRVIMQQGYTRYHAKVRVEQLLQLFDELRSEGAEELEVQDADGGAAMDVDSFADFVEETIDTLQDILQNLEPDESLVTTDAVELSAPGGALSDSSIGAAGDVARLIERMITQGGKTIPLLMGSNEAVSETHANRQWEIHVAAIRTVQHIIESYFQHLASVGLQAAGLQGHVKLRFAELRKSEEKRDAETSLVKARVAQLYYLMGWISHTEASVMTTGHAPDAERPRIIDLSTGNDLAASDFGGYSPSDGDAPRVQGTAVRRRRVVVGDLPPVPAELNISDADVNAAIRLWNRLMPNYTGLLNASITDVSETSSPWRFDPAGYQYTNEDTGEVVGQQRLIELRDEFSTATRTDSQRSIRAGGASTRTNISELVDDLLGENITLAEWVTEMREAIKSSYIAQYVAARGGRHNMTSADWGRIGRMMAPDGQYYYLARFAEDIANGGLSRAQIVARANMYLRSSTQAGERGRAAAYGVVLPTYPGDGTQACLSNCQCHWEYSVFDSEIRCYWRLGNADHCETCLSNAAKYNPYIPEEQP